MPWQRLGFSQFPQTDYLDSITRKNILKLRFLQSTEMLSNRFGKTIQGGKVDDLLRCCCHASKSHPSRHPKASWVAPQFNGEAWMIELRHLRYFVAVAEELNFRRAAERIHIDQTPLSRTVRDLEDQLGVQLFVRLPRKLELTPAGFRLLKETRKVFIRIERAQRAVRETDTRFRAPLRIGVADGVAQVKLSQCLVRWRDVAPEIHLVLTEMPAPELTQALRNEEIDAGFSFGLPGDEAIAQQSAWSYPAMALLPLGHELTLRLELPLAELLAFPLVSYHAKRLPGLHLQLRTILERHTATPTIAGEACTLNGFVTRIAAGMGVGLGDAGHIATLRRSDVVTLPLREVERITTYVLHKRQRFGSADALQRFLAHATCSDRYAHRANGEGA